MKYIEMSGKTVQDALGKALKELNATEDKVDVEIITEGSNGLFGLFGAKPATIKVTVRKNNLADAKEFILELLRIMKIDAEVIFRDEKDSIKIDINGINMGILIGYRGETLDSLQYLLSLIVNKGHEGEYRRVVLDTENYRLKREETLRRLAEKVAYRVRRSGRYVKLEPMNPYERRIIHFALQEDPNVETYSEGEEPYRRVVVDLKKA
ncbi:MAG TPA: RNA-binding cell elongation regulator Jag/EloR [Clostridiaceae bacterium]